MAYECILENSKRLREFQQCCCCSYSILFEYTLKGSREMSATFYYAQTAMTPDHASFRRERFSMPQAGTAYMCMSAATCAILLTTGVVTSVSLFVLILVFVPLLLLGLVVLISLLLTCLTGLVTLESLVGLEIERTVRTAKGD